MGGWMPCAQRKSTLLCTTSTCRARTYTHIVYREYLTQQQTIIFISCLPVVKGSILSRSGGSSGSRWVGVHISLSAPHHTMLCCSLVYILIKTRRRRRKKKKRKKKSRVRAPNKMANLGAQGFFPIKIVAAASAAACTE